MTYQFHSPFLSVNPRFKSNPNCTSCFFSSTCSSSAMLHSQALTVHKTLQDLNIPPVFFLIFTTLLVSSLCSNSLQSSWHQSPQNASSNGAKKNWCLLYHVHSWIFSFSSLCLPWEHFHLHWSHQLTGQHLGKDTEMHTHPGTSPAVLQHEVLPIRVPRCGCDLHGVRLWRWVH